jgi:hypothetical protein
MPMTNNTLSTDKSYDPNRLLDAVKDMLKLDSDLALSEVLEVPAPVISQIRHRGYPIGPSILIRMHDLTTLSVQELREIMGDRRKKIRTSYDEAFLAEIGPEQRDSVEATSTGERYFYLVLAAVVLLLLWSLIL